MQKAFRISLFFFSLILTIFALINLIMPNIHLNELNLNDLLLILYFIGILGSGIFILFSNLDKISMWLNIILLLITIFTWIKYPTIGIVYTPFVVYSILNLLLLLVQVQTSSDHNQYCRIYYIFFSKSFLTNSHLFQNFSIRKKNRIQRIQFQKMSDFCQCLSLITLQNNI